MAGGQPGCRAGRAASLLGCSRPSGSRSKSAAGSSSSRPTSPSCPATRSGSSAATGPGKTSLFRVLGGESDPAAGRVIRKGGFGYLPQDPRIAGVLDGRTAVDHVLSGRGIDQELERLEKLRIAVEEHPDERNVARFSRAEETFRTNGGYAAESEGAGDGGRARDRRGPGHVADRRAVGRRAAARRAGPDPVRRQRRAAASTSRPTTSTSTPRSGCSGSCARTAARCSSSATTSSCSTRRSRASSTSIARPRTRRASSSSTRAPTPSTSRPAPRTRPRRKKLAARQKKQLARMQAVVDRFGAKATKAAMAHNMEKRIARLEAERVDDPRAAKLLRVRLPTPPTPGRTVVTATGLRKSYGSQHGVRRRGLRPRARRAAARARAQRGRQDEPAAHPRRRDRRRPGRRRVRPQRHRRVLRPGARQPSTRRDAARQPPRRGAGRHRV